MKAVTTSRVLLRFPAIVSHLLRRLNTGRAVESIIADVLDRRTGSTLGSRPEGRLSPGHAAAALAFSIALWQAASASPAAAASATASGPSALALAAVLSADSAVHNSFDKRILARLFAGDTNISFPPNKKITVKAESVTCRVSNVDITARSCELVYTSGKRALKGREANELYGTLAVAGVVAEGAAGSMIEGITNLECIIDPNVVKQKGGGGADCTFTTAQ